MTKKNKLTLTQARSEGWTLSTNPIGIQPLTTGNGSAVQARSKVLVEALGGSSYHLDALHAVLTSCLDAFRIRPDVIVGDWVKLTETITGAGDEPVTYRSGEVAKVNDLDTTRVILRMKDDTLYSFADHENPDEPWFPFVKIDTFQVAHQGVVLIVDKSSGAVLTALSPDEINTPDLSFVTWVDVADIEHSFGSIPDTIDLELVTYAGRDGQRTVADRKAYIQKQLADIDPVLARLVATQSNP